jgi:hypothetical protein
MQKEIWKDVPNYEGRYQVSNIGNVTSLNYKMQGITKKLAQASGKNGYNDVVLCRNGSRRTFRVHVLVSMAFLDHKPCGHKLVVDHIDNDKKNNKVSNLRLITNRANISRQTRKTSSEYVGVSWHKTNKKWNAHIKINGVKKFLGGFVDEKDAHIAYQSRLKTIRE